ncbi:MAG: TonB family protein [Acidobacteriota bacterium]|nr:TonB family protein [Acidobacteriota bacterium]
MYRFREEAKPKFDLKYSTLMALALLLLLITIGANADVFRLSAAELVQLQEEKKEQQREMMFRFMDAPEDEEAPEDPKFASDAQHIKRAPTEDAPDEEPDPYSEGDTYELQNNPVVRPNPQPQPAVPPQPPRQPQPALQPQQQMVENKTEPTPEQEQEQEQREEEATEDEAAAEPEEMEETVEETQDEAPVEEPEKVEVEEPDPRAEPTDIPKKSELKPAEEGDVDLPVGAPRPYRPITQQQMQAARKSAMKNMQASQPAPNRYVDSSRYDNRRGSGAPNLGLTVETTRSDLGAYLRILKQKVQGNWRIPNIARFEVAGVTGVSFNIHKDGRISDIKVILASKHEPLDVSALNAIKNTNPAPPLPQHVDDDFIPIKFGFYYNMRPRY